MCSHLVLVLSFARAMAETAGDVETGYKGNCVDKGCREELGSNGLCVDFFKEVDFSHLASSFNLSFGSAKGLCGHKTDEQQDCCHCMLRSEDFGSPGDIDGTGTGGTGTDGTDGTGTGGTDGTGGTGGTGGTDGTGASTGDGDEDKTTSTTTTSTTTTTTTTSTTTTT